MVPMKIMKKAAEREIEMLAICDHNSCENAASFMTVGEKQNITILPGMEVCTKEEAHILGIFGGLENALAFQELVYENLEGVNDPETFGYQVIVDEKGDPMGINEKLLIGSIKLPVEQVVASIHSLGGIVIASHINKDVFSIVGQLGFIPEDLKLDAVELSKHVSREEFPKWQEEYQRFPIVSFSDAHFLEEIGQACTSFRIEEPNFDEFKKALCHEDGREIVG